MAQIVELPNGDTVEFPDEMGADAISSAISQSFPEFAPQPTGQTAGDLISDVGVSFAGGANALLETGGNLAGLVGVADMDNWASRQGKSGREYWESEKSAALKADEAERRAAIDSADGQWAKAGTAFWETVKNPALLSSFVAEQAPMFLPVGMVGRAGQVASLATGVAGKTAGAAGKLAGKIGTEGMAARLAQKRLAGLGTAEGAAGAIGTGVGIGAGAALQGADVGGDAYEELLKLPDTLWAQNEDYQALRAEIGNDQAAKEEIALSLARQAGAEGGVASVLTNLLPFARTFERATAGASTKLNGGIIARGIKGFAGESLQEASEEGLGRVSVNRAVGDIDPTREWSQGVGEASGMGAVGGGAMGLGAGLISSPKPTQPTPADDLSTLSREVKGSPEGDATVDNFNSEMDAAMLGDRVLADALERAQGVEIETTLPETQDGTTPTDVAPVVDRRIVEGGGIESLGGAAGGVLQPEVIAGTGRVGVPAAPMAIDVPGELAPGVAGAEGEALAQQPATAVDSKIIETRADAYYVAGNAKINEGLKEEGLHLMAQGDAILRGEQPKPFAPQEQQPATPILTPGGVSEAVSARTMPGTTQQEAPAAEAVTKPAPEFERIVKKAREVGVSDARIKEIGTDTTALTKEIGRAVMNMDFGRKAGVQPSKPVGALASLLDQYENTGEIGSANELADSIEALEDVPVPVAAALKAYREDRQYDREVSGRGDMDAAEARLIAAMRSPATPLPVSAPKPDVLPPAPKSNVNREAIVLQNKDRSSPALTKQMQGIAASPDYSMVAPSNDATTGTPITFGDLPQSARPGRNGITNTSHGRKLPIQYAAVEADDLIASHNVDGTTIAEYEQGVEGKLRAIGGNARIAGIKEAYRRGNTQYATALRADIETHGIDTSGMKAPVLVRIMRNEDVTPNIGIELNARTNTAPQVVDQAKDDARTFKIENIELAEDGTPSSSALRQFVLSMPENEHSGLMDRGQPNKVAQDRLNAAIFYQAYGNEELVRIYAESTDEEAKAVISALAMAAPSMAKLENTDVDVRDIVTDAAKIAVAARRAGKSLLTASQQLDIEYGQPAMWLVKYFAENIRAPKRIGEMLTNLANRAYDESTKPAVDMFGAVEKKTREQLLQEQGYEPRTTQGNERIVRPELIPISRRAEADEQNRPVEAPAGQEPAQEFDLEQQTEASLAEQEGRAEHALILAEAEQRNLEREDQRKQEDAKTPTPEAKKPKAKVTPQTISTAQAESVISASADSVKTLRKADVGRVLDETPAPWKLSMAQYIKDNRRDLEDEVNAVMAEEVQPAAETNPAKTIAEASPADLLRAAADKMDAGKAAPKSVVAKPVPTPLNPDQAAIDQADSDFDDALGDLGDIVGKNFRATLTPEQEQKLLPVLTKLFDAAFRKGYYKFKEAARFVLDAIKAKFGAEIEEQISLDSLQGAYIGMAGRYKDQGADKPRDVVSVESKDELGESNVTDRRSSSYLERHRQDAEVADGVGAEGVRDGRGRDGGIRGQGIQESEDAGGAGGGVGISGSEADISGERGDLEIYAGTPPSESSIAGDSVNRGSDSSGLDGSPVESDAASVAEELAESGLSLEKAKLAQLKADKAEHKPGLANIRETLPILTEGQQEDVHTAETRFAKPDGYGMLFTNGTGTGKAQPLDAKILTPTGWKRMGDMRIGDNVITGDGSVTVVTGVFPQGEKPIYRVEFSDGAATECCDEHLWLTQTLYARRKARTNADWNCAQPQVLHLSEIRASLDEQHFIPVVGEVETHSDPLPIPAYTLGVILGDGCLRGGSITFSGKDAELAEYVAVDLPQGFHVVPVTVQENRCPTWRISADTERLENGQFPSHPMIDALRDLGLFGMDSFGKFVPEPYLFSSRADRIAMLRGLMDTDGTVDHRTGSISFSSVSPQLRDGVIALVRSLGGIATYTQKTPTYTHNGEKRIGQVAYTVYIHIGNSISLFSLSRKQNLVTPKLYAPRRKIVGVVDVGAKQAQCISVAHPSRLYVTDDYIVTHNTFSGLGIIKRFDTAGKNNIIVTVPNDKIKDDWTKAGKLLGLNISSLENIKTAGSGIVITTYANFGQNDELAKRDWDLIVHDEAHYLKQDSKGTDTLSLNTLRAISLHPDGASTRASMLHAKLVSDLKGAAAAAKMARMSDDQRDWAKIAGLEKIEGDLAAKWREARDKVRDDVNAKQGEARPRVLFLSATPFAYEKTVDWANGYLFNYNEGRSSSGSMTRSYNAGSNSDQFMMQHFGYRMRTGKLTEPDAKVDRGLMQRQFNSFLKKRGVLAGRMLDVKADYDRKFVLVESAIGQRIDEALEWFENQRKAGRPEINREAGVSAFDIKPPTPRENALGALRDTIGEKFDYLSRRYLLEAIKAQEVIPHVKEHMALGRKVVVFHDYKKGGGFNPFNVTESTADVSNTTDGAAEAQAVYNAVVREFRAEFKDLIESDVWNASSPIIGFKKAFPGVLLFNGDVPAKDRRAAVEKFQDDASGVQVMLVQSAAGKEGISLHDTSGKHQRVLFNLGQPTQPTTAIQQEGRIYRTGQATDAIFRYLNTGTGWEKWAFATTIAQRASAAENLGMGEQARALKDAFIAGFDESDDYRAGMEDEGKGGKERDKAANNALTEYDRARAFYFGTQKKNSRTKAQEGADYFATPEPVGLKMVELADIRPGEHVLEPSAGHGAIARWIPETSTRTAIEPSMTLRPRLAMVFDGNIIGDDFESLHINNKYDAIVMNPPFGTAGRTAVDHIAKAATHLRDGGRIVALLPVGSATAKFDKWFYEEETSKIKPLAVHPTLGAIYKGDTIKVVGYGGGFKVLSEVGGAFSLKSETIEMSQATDSRRLESIEPTGNRGAVRTAAGLNLVAEILMPSVTFERAGTAVNTRIVVIEKSDRAAQQVNRDYSDIADINELFDRMENLTIPERAKAQQAEPETVAPKFRNQVANEHAKAREAEAVAAGLVANEGEDQTFEIKDGKLITNAPTEKVVKRNGKIIEGVFVPNGKYSYAEIKAVDEFTYSPGGREKGLFVRIKHIVRPGVVVEQPAQEYTLKPQTRAELLEQQARIDAANKEKDALEAKLIKEEKDRLAHEDIKRRSVEAAKTFELGQDAATNLSGQASLFQKAKDYDTRQLDLLINDHPLRPGEDTAETKSDRTGLAAATLLRGARGSLLGLSLATDWIVGKGSSLIGKRVTSPQDIATLGAVLRDPRAETFRYFLIKEGRVVYHTAVSSRMLGSSAAFIGDTKVFIADLQAIMDRLGADGYYLMHNHPGRNVEASSADIHLTEMIADRLPGFLGHTILDHTEFGLIEVDVERGNTAYDAGAQPISTIGTDPTRTTPIPHAKLDEVVSSPETLARMADAVRQPDNIVLVATDHQMHVTGIMQVSRESMKKGGISSLKIMARLRKVAGAHEIFAILPEGMRFNELPQHITKNGWLLDVHVAVAGKGVSAVNENMMAYRRGGAKRKDKLGMAVDQPQAEYDVLASMNEAARDEVAEQEGKTLESRQTSIPGTTTPPAQPPRQGKVPLQGGQTGNNASWDSPVPSKLDTFLQVMQDKHIDLRRVTEAIKSTGKQIADSVNAYLQEELFHGRAAERTKLFLEKEMTPLVEEMRMRGVKMADFEEYLWMRHAEERNLAMEERNPDRDDNKALSGIDTETARDYLANLSPEKRKAYESLAKRVDAMNKGTRRVWVEYGLESPNTVQSMEDAYDNYVPLMREDMDHGHGGGTGQGFSVKGNATKRATGSNRAVVDILANMALARERAIVRGEKNRVALALIGLATLNPNPEFWKVNTPPTIRTVNERTGLVEVRVDPAYKSRDNVVMARTVRNGKVVEYSVTFNEHDERAMRMALSLKNLDQDQMSEWLGSIGNVTRYFAAVNTQYNPMFGVINIIRDIGSGALNLTTTKLKGKEGRILKDVPGALRGIYKDIRNRRGGKPATSEWSKLFEEFKAEGGQTGFRDQYKNAKDRAEAIEQALNPDWWMDTKVGKVLTAGGALNAPAGVFADKAVKPTFEWLSDYNEAMENAVRLAAYKEARDMGLSKQESASIAKNLTVNFNRKGRIGREMGSLYAFFNASVQGTARMAETLVGPRGKQIIAGGIALGVMQAVAMAMAGMDDDEPPDFVKDRNIIIPTGDGKYLSIPMPLGFNVLSVLGRSIAEAFIYGKPMKRALHVGEVMLDMFNPIGTASVLQTLTPTVADPLAAIIENKDWTGKPIAREDFNSLSPTPGHSRAKDTSTAISRGISEALNYLTGGNKYRAGMISPTPDQIDYLAAQVGGGVWRETSKVGQAAESVITGQELPSYKRPLVGKFYGDTTDQASQGGKFYQNLKDLNELEAEIKGRKKDRIPTADIYVEHPEARLVGAANRAEQDVQELRRKRRKLIEQSAPTERIKIIDMRITAKMKRLNEQVKQSEARQ